MSMRCVRVLVVACCAITTAHSFLFGSGSGSGHSARNSTGGNKRLSRTRSMIDAVLRRLHVRWQIKQFPNFLRSVGMPQSSWDALKAKYELKILKSMVGSHQKFVISFLGSSVTAGHDTAFNITFSELTRGVLLAPFTVAGLELVVINGAMGNNPCLPYDACVRTFAGPDADIVHWEQSFNCFGTDPGKKVEFEQFIRQSVALPSMPVVVFSTSSTPNWPADDCKDKDPKAAPKHDPADDALLALLDKEPSKVATENRGDEGQWSSMLDMFRQYKAAGVQMWHHDHYEKYKCMGPYGANWGCCAASWHPSKLGHELRAAHYSYFWLLILRDAIIDLEKMIQKEGSAEKALEKVEQRVAVERKHMPPAPLTPSKFSDAMRCMTTYEPRADPDAHLMDYVVPADNSKWERAVMEDMLEGKGAVLAKARAQGYKDFKYMLYGNKDSGPLHIKITVQRKGTVMVAQPPGVWGKLPDGFKWLWDAEAKTKMFLTHHVPANITTQKEPHEGTKWVFDEQKATQVSYTCPNPKETQTVYAYLDQEVEPGVHVLTILPPSTGDKIMVATVLLP